MRVNQSTNESQSWHVGPVPAAGACSRDRSLVMAADIIQATSGFLVQVRLAGALVAMANPVSHIIVSGGDAAPGRTSDSCRMVLKRVQYNLGKAQPDRVIFSLRWKNFLHTAIAGD